MVGLCVGIVKLWASCMACCSCGANVCWVGGVSWLCVHMIVMRVSLC